MVFSAKISSNLTHEFPAFSVGLKYFRKVSHGWMNVDGENKETSTYRDENFSYRGCERSLQLL